MNRYGDGTPWSSERGEPGYGGNTANAGKENTSSLGSGDLLSEPDYKSYWTNSLEIEQPASLV